MANKRNKFLLLMWKNWILIRRRPIGTFFEIIIPVLLCILLVVIRGLIGSSSESETQYRPFIADNNYWTNIKLGYSPSNNPHIDAIMTTLAGAKTNLVLDSFDNSSDLETNVMVNQDDLEQCSTFYQGGIQFPDSLRGNVPLPEDLTVTIRLLSDQDCKEEAWETNLVYPVFQIPGPRDRNNDHPEDPGYYQRGFLELQSLIASAITKYRTGLPDVLDDAPPIILNRYPYPAYYRDLFYNSAMETAVSMLIMIGFMYNCVNTIRSITTEKEKQLKESMKVMGLPGWLHWVAWFVRSFLFAIVIVVIMTIVLKVPFQERPVFNKSDGSLLFVFFLLFASSLIAYSFLISVFFSKANTAAAVGTLVFFLSYLPYTIQQPQYDSLSLFAKLGSSMLPNSALGFGMSLTLKYEGIEEGIQWNNLFSPVSPDDDLTFGAIMLILILQICVFLLITMYVEAVFPGDFGIPLPWYFPFTKDYWCGGAPIHDDHMNEVESEFFEKFSENLPTGIHIKNLSKSFRDNNAVKKLNLKMYEGHITALLGHNGAGKTTTMSMLTGMFPPTSGTAIVNGHDVRTDVQGVRDSMGLCLQHNVLFDNLTVSEHLYFFGKLKGLDSSQISAEIDLYIKLLELEDKRNALSRSLSGGMKRKLSVGMALCGNSKVVMLDEPTAGMDPSARRAIWDLLQKQKHERTILLTTHFMDEADLLGDRIAIMSAGEMQCCGSSFFLKKKYGAGYYLIMDVTHDCDTSKITQQLRTHIPNITIQAHVGSELTYLLAESDSSKFEDMLLGLETNITKLKINSYGISLTTLEEVFMKVGADHDNEASQEYNRTNGHTEIIIDKTNFVDLKVPLLTGFALMKNQVSAMFFKKAIATLRSWMLIIIQIIVPVLFIVITVDSARNVIDQNSYRALSISFDSYQDPVTLLSGDSSNEFYKTYLNLAQEKSTVKETTDISQSILQTTQDTPFIAKKTYIAGATFTSTSSIAWFNGDPYHGIPLAFGLMLNIYHKQYAGEQFSLNFINYPLPITLLTRSQQGSSFNVMGSQVAIVLGYGMAFVASFYILFCIKERMSKSKHLQFASGVDVWTFWCTALVWDMAIYLVNLVAILITFVALQEDGFKSGEDLGHMTVILLYFGINVLPLMYLFSHFFNEPSTGFSRVMFLGALTGIVGVTVLQVLEIDDLDLMYVAVPLHWVLLFLPYYALSRGVTDVYTIYTYQALKEQNPIVCVRKPEICNSYYAMTTPGIGRNVIISLIMSVVFFLTLIAVEYGLFSKIKEKIFNSMKSPVVVNDLDEDVVAENRAIHKIASLQAESQYALVLNNVTKYYKQFRAVNGICLGVKKSECFGLLGVNGAGKTTTFKMMTGDESISHGEVFVQGVSINANPKQVQKMIGYCPQFDALLDDLTARETLKIYCLIRGVPTEEIKYISEKLAHEFDFFRHIDKKVKELSGGNKRKLSTALALIGNPSVIFLDEPTAGMDPATKRFLWTALCKLRDSGKCIILTSHSMEECEALCTRLAIMVNGSFKCLGSTQRLKNKFAQGYALTIKVKKVPGANQRDQEIAAIEDFIQREFPGALLREKHQELLSYQLNHTGMPWSKMFGILEKSKKQLSIEDYSLGQCSLEQVFLSFTKYQQ